MDLHSHYHSISKKTCSIETPPSERLHLVPIADEPCRPRLVMSPEGWNWMFVLLLYSVAIN